MKVCHCTTVHPRDDIRILFKQCNSLVMENHEVFLIVADGLGNENRDGVEIVDIGNFRTNRFKRITKAKKRLLKMALNLEADIYQFHDPELISVGKKIKSKGGKVVYDSHEDVPKQILYKSWLGPIWFRKILARQYDRYEKNTIKKFDGLISVIDEITDKFECNYKITLKNFPIVSRYKSYIKTYDEKNKLIVYVGSISKERGIKDCIEALRYIPEEYKLILIGGFVSNEFHQECQNLPEWSRVDYKGFLKLDEVAPLLGNSMVGLSVLHPEENYKTSLPTKGFEYMAAGTPVVLSDFNYWKPFFKDSGLFIKPCSPELIGNAINEIISNKENYALIQSHCQINANKYSWETEAKKLIMLYKNILS